MRIYLDSSAIVKLVQSEPESPALRRYLRRNRTDGRVTSALARVEVLRALHAGGTAARAAARRHLQRLDQIQLTAPLLDQAAALAPGRHVRSLDAIHLAAAQLVGTDLRCVLTYDLRMAEAAESLGLAVAAPA